jgi:hypothetical protein
LQRRPPLSKLIKKEMKMTVKSEVQGIVQALFGAYAGGYLAELTAEATANGSSAVAARLVTIQGVILGRNMSDNQDFVDTILNNMGVPSTNNAYEAAAAWAMGELTAGASRADIVSAAVAFLDGIAAGTIVDSKYTAVAEAFAASVEAGIEYSEDAGEEEFSLATLQEESGIAAPFNLAAALAKLSAAQEVEAEAFAAAAQVAAENAEALGYDIDDIDGSDGSDPDGEISADEIAAFAESYVALASSAEPAANLAEAEDVVNAAEDALANARADAIDAPAALSEYDGLTASDARLTAMLADAQALFDADADNEIADAQEVIDTAEAAVSDDVDANGTNVELLETLRDAIIAVGNGTADYVTGAETQGEVLVIVLAALAEGGDVEGAIAAITEFGAADSGNDDIDAVGGLIIARAGLIAAVDDAEAAYADVPAVADLATVETLVEARQDLIAAIPAAEELLDAVTLVAEAHADAVAATDEAEEALDLAGWAVQVLGDDATVGNDVYLALDLEDDVAFEDFGAADLIFFGAGFTLVTLTEEDEAADIVGSVSTKEIFVIDDGANTTLYVEMNAFDGTATSNGDIVTIELTGVTGGTVTLTESGYFAVA